MLYRGFVGPSYTSQSPIADAERCVNWYVEGMESAGAKAPSALYPCPGFDEFGSVAESPVRGLFATGTIVNRVFAAIGFKLYEFDNAGSATSRGTIDSDDHPATFATNGSQGGQMMVTSGGTLYVYDLAADSLTAIAALSAINIQQVVYLNNRFIALDAENSAIYWSALNDGSSWSTLNKAQRSTAADPWISMSVVLGQLWLLGTLTSDVYAPTNDPTDPYQPIPGAYLEQGIAANFSGTNLDSTLVWVSGNAQGARMAFRSIGYVPQRISTHAVEFAWQGYETISDCVSWSYQDQGHSFAVFNFPTAEATWVYDTATGLWHERGYWDTDTNSYTTYRAQSHCYAFNQHLVGDRETGTIYTMSIENQYDVDESVIRRLRQAPHVWDGNEGSRVFYPGLQIDMQTGLGDSAITGDPPQAVLSWSDDGGLSFPVELTASASAGNLGERTTRVIYRRLGHSRDRVYRLVCSDPVPWRVVQAWFRPEPRVGIN